MSDRDRSLFEGNTCDGRKSVIMVILFGFVGLILGLIAGAVTGFGVGSVCVEIFQVSKFEGGAGMLVFYTFTPAGAIIGGILGAWLLGRLGMKKDAEPRISRRFAFVILAIAAGLVWWAWYEFIRSPYLTHGADAEMTLSMQFRLPPAITLPGRSDDLELAVNDGDGHASVYYGERWLGAGKWYVLDGDRQVLLASAELNQITCWRKVSLRLPNIPEQVWTLDLDADPYPIVEYTHWRRANGASSSKIEMRFRLTADRCAVCAFRNE
jgi:MFS family permease